MRELTVIVNEDLNGNYTLFIDSHTPSFPSFKLTVTSALIARENLEYVDMYQMLFRQYADYLPTYFKELEEQDQNQEAENDNNVQSGQEGDISETISDN